MGLADRTMSNPYDISRFVAHGMELRLVEDDVRGWIRIEAILQVNDRDSGRPSDIAFVESVDRYFWEKMGELHRTRVVLNVLKRMLIHELEECFLVNGERVCDPHKDEVSK